MKCSWTPLSDSVYGSVLKIKDVTILLDCGCDVDFDVSAIASVAKDIDLVLISHHDLRHCGALAAAKAKHGLRAPVYATTCAAIERARASRTAPATRGSTRA